jgi:hypothetical protein
MAFKYRKTAVILSLFLFMPMTAVFCQDEEALPPFTSSVDLFCRNPSLVTVPEDFDLGTVFTEWTGDMPDIFAPEAVTAAERFLDSLALGRISSDLVHPDVLFPLTLKLTENYLDRGVLIDGYRFGIPYREGTSLCVPVRLTAGENSAAGRLYLLADNGEWKIEDLEVDFRRLAEEKKREEVFRPSSRWDRLF